MPSEYLWEAKQTDGKSITIKLDDWEKLRKNAISLAQAGMHMQIATAADFVGARRLLMTTTRRVILITLTLHHWAISALKRLTGHVPAPPRCCCPTSSGTS